jgi:hypothetical protein
MGLVVSTIRGASRFQELTEKVLRNYVFIK